MSVKISFSDLWTYGPSWWESIWIFGDGINNKHYPLSKLNKNRIDIHGRLEIKVDGKLLPYLGYFGPDDVCMKDWITELTEIIKKFDAGENTYTYEDHEQGQPNFVFEKEGDTVYVSVVEKSQDTQDEPRSDWQKIPFSFMEFKKEYFKFRHDFLEEIQEQKPAVLNKWRELFICDNIIAN